MYETPHQQHKWHKPDEFELPAEWKSDYIQAYANTANSFPPRTKFEVHKNLDPDPTIHHSGFRV